MILEEFEQSDSISLNYILYLLDQRIKLVRTFEVSEVGVVGGFSSSGRAVDSVFKNGTVLKEFNILNFVVLMSINKGDACNLVF
jgi:hypothetical protein